MARRGRNEQPSVPINMRLRNKLELIWVKLSSKSNELARRSKHMARLMDASKPRKIPTELELCLFICSVFPQDFGIPVDDLVIYMMGINLFKDVHYMIEARHLIHDIVHDLTTRYMIELCGKENNSLGDRTRARDEIHLDFSVDEEEINQDVENAGWLSNELRREKDEYDNQHVKMLADGHDLAKLIATKYGLVIGCATVTNNRLFMYEYEDYNALSLVLKSVSKYSNYANCPKLALLHLQHGKDSQGFPVGIFKQLNKLQVLSLDIPSLNQSLKVPRNLRTLRLKVLKLEDMSWIGRLKYLEFLSISTLSLRYIPKEMKQLLNLRFLDLRESTNLLYIPPGVLSRMLKLEELYLPLSYKRWGCRGEEDDDYDCSESEEGDKINASFNEITSLSLYALQISLQDASILPKKTSTFKKIQRFRILIHNDFKYQPLGEGQMNKLQLRGDAFDIKRSGIWDLMRRVEDLSLIKVRNLKNVMSRLEDYEFPQLKKMIITKCDELEHLFVTTENWIPNNSFSELKYLHLSMLSNLKEIWHGTRPGFGWFDNLRRINIRFCQKLKYIFPLSIAKGLRRLKSIEILDCNEMDGILYGNDEGDENLNEACFIEELHLYSLPKLVGFLVNKDLLMTINEIVSTSIERPIGAFDSTSRIDDEQLISLEQNVVSNNQVSHTKIKDAISLKETYSAFSLMEKQLRSLTKLKIAFCDALQIIFLFKENDATIRGVNSLRVLELYGLQNLRHIWFQMPPKIMPFLNLQHLVLSECHNILYAFPYRVAKLMVQLKKVLELQDMPKLRVFYGGISSIVMPLLETLKLDQCNKMECFSYSSLSTRMLERIQMNGSSYPLLGDLNTTINRLKVEKL
ncbi:disease resistance protein At4g27190-like isoform X2 [Euphorbia lathyris]|uniref:disease resistance protein At4g27190-like isoform X2 n=1 Tax=Euphorbia lathyris TaxID=212925 RepID=UPI0033130C21